MKEYKVKVKFITDYYQARYTEEAKQELENYISKGIVKSEEDSWAALMYFDDNGTYVPAYHLRKALVNAAKEFRIKKQRRSMQQWAISNLMVFPENIYLGKKKPDKIDVSYPKRKDGMRVKIKHPVFLSGTTIEFLIKTLDGDMEDKAIENLVVMAGKMYGIGARRSDMKGRFELISFVKN